MPVQVQIKYSDDKLKRVQNVLRDFPQDMARVMPRAINRSMRTTRAKAARLIKADTPKLKVGDVKKRIHEDKATRAIWRGKLSMSPWAISMSRFAYKPTKAGVPYQIQNGRTIAKRAFRIRGTGALLVRESAEYDWDGFDYIDGDFEGSDNLVGRLPIHKLTGPSLSDLYSEAPATVSRVGREAAKSLDKNMDREVNYALIRRMPR